MNRKFDLVVFDWDGTIMDSETKIVRCMQAAACDLKIPDPGVAAIRDIIGLGLNEAMQVLFPGSAASDKARLAERYRRHFLELDNTAMPLFPGVVEGLTRLAEQGYLLAVATGKARRGLNRVLDETGMRQLFVTSRCADETCSKPHPQMLEEILDQTGTETGRALMVGDTVYDMQMAQSARVTGLGVSYGVHPRERLLECGAFACVDSFREVCAWIT
jgi:phosphoglycolate phosphatase